ncbi:MAG: hypothetical protein KDB16_08180 [Acidimicrobiales bacterium]|nr:hypothetical protein [Acidimicrobiales bacterium]
MKVLVTAHDAATSRLSIIDLGLHCVREIEALADIEQVPCLAELDGEVAIALDVPVRTGEFSLVKGKEAASIAGYTFPLGDVHPELTRGPAKELIGCPAYLIDTPDGPTTIVIAGTRPVDELIAAARQDRQRAHAEGEAQAAAQAARAAQAEPDVFINPYTFVPFPTAAPAGFRAEPAGHHQLASGRYSGRIAVTFTAATPLLTRGPENRWPRDADGRPILPGSSLKGALRSLHEVLVGGCLRVIDGDFVPVYRDIARVHDSSWTLAVVAATDGDAPTRFSLCDQVVWTSSSELHRAVPPAELQSGTRVAIGRTAPGNHGRLNGFDVRRGGDWVVHITDASARDHRHPYYAACGHLDGSSAELADHEVWRRFLEVVDGTRDLESGPANVDVVLNGHRIGRRRPASRHMNVGDVVWVNVQHGAVTEIKLSYLWRSRGSGTLRDRVPDWLLPCHEHLLCPTCRVFGSAEETPTRGDERAEQHSYRGHVRFNDVVVTAGDPEPVDLPPLGRPRPGAGAFYLTMDGSRVARTRDEIPVARWGAAADTTIRLVRGRKFYWNADPSLQHPRRDRRGPGQQNANMGGDAEILPAGSTLSTAITFVNLSEQELGGLIAVLQPSLALAPYVPVGYMKEPQPLQLRLGGGKPLGLGAVDCTIDQLTVESAASRYLGAEGPTCELGQLVDAFVRHMQEAAPDIVSTWPDVAAVLRHGHVNPARVAYPPSGDWPAADADEPATFRETFRFFGKVTGSNLCEPGFTTLNPSPRSPEQQLPNWQKPERR